MDVSVETLQKHYSDLTDRAGLWERHDRALLELRGADRSAWLNNLITNLVKTLSAGDGNYAFAVNLKGRTVFDLNCLVLDSHDRADGALLLDIDLGWRDAAMRHLNKYIITEQVEIRERTSEFSRLAVAGPRTAEVAGLLGCGNFAAMPALQHVLIGEASEAARLIRHDFSGPPGMELICPATIGAQWDSRAGAAVTAVGGSRVTADSIDLVRIECGLPWSRRDIDEDVVPPETLQIERGISYHKGCYLGQEVIERMRSHGVVARRLVGLRFGGSTMPATPAVLRRDGAEVGRVTSVCRSIRLGAMVGLGYVKSAHATVGTEMEALSANGRSTKATVMQLPMASA